MHSPSQRNLIAVIGTTGVGKSQLAVELALSLNRSANNNEPTAGAEIINADSMQIYKGMDVITNKATPSEMRDVPHHLMGFLNPGEEYRVGQFQKDALSKIDELHREDRVPIAVGGTTYYVQNLIFPNQLVADVPSAVASLAPPLELSSRIALPPRTIADLDHFPAELRATILALPLPLLQLFYLLPSLPLTSTPDYFPPGFPVDSLPESFRTADEFVNACFQLLLALDEESAARWHWRDVRKVRRSVEVVWEGRRWCDVLQSQEAKGEGPRFRTMIFWVYADPEVLKPRLDARVDKMVDRGLMDEINELWELARQAKESGTAINYSVGIYQAIGFKEFTPYLTERLDSTSVDVQDPKFKAGLESMKISTRQYSKKQVHWIKRKLIPAIEKSAEIAEGEVTLILLDATDLSRWEDRIRGPAVELMNKFLAGESLPDPRLLSEAAALHLPNTLTNESITASLKRVCTICTTDPLRPIAVEQRHWDQHMNGKAHRKMARGPQDNARDRWLATLAEREKAAVVEAVGEVEGLSDSSKG